MQKDTRLRGQARFARAALERQVQAELGAVTREILLRDHEGELAELAKLAEKGRAPDVERAYRRWVVRLAQVRAQAEDELRRPVTMFELAGQQRLELERCKQIDARYEREQPRGAERSRYAADGREVKRAG